jgi:serine/threonine protein kinase
MKRKIGPYQILRLIHQGNFGSTYLGTTTHANKSVRKVILKELTTEMPTLPTEALHLIQLNHPNIVNILDIQSFRKVTWIITDFIPGWNLSDFMSLMKTHNLSSSEQTYLYLQIISQCLEAIMYLKQHQVVHGDIHPSNIRITPHAQVVLIDFGITQQVEPNELKRSKGFRHHWSSPQRLKTNIHGPHEDFFGLTRLAELLLKQFPIEATESASIFQNLTLNFILKQPHELENHWMSTSETLLNLKLTSELSLNSLQFKQNIQSWHIDSSNKTLPFPSSLSLTHSHKRSLSIRAISAAILLFFIISMMPVDSLSSLKPRKLLIQARPWAVVSVDNKNLGTTPIQVLLEPRSQPIQIKATFQKKTIVKNLMWFDFVNAQAEPMTFEMERN